MKKKEERQAVHDKFDGKCAYCGCELEKGWHVDHMKPVNRVRKFKMDENGERISNKSGYGFITITVMDNPERDVFENKVPACASCNINKRGYDVESFRGLIENFLNSLNKRFVQYKFVKRYGLVKETGADVIFYFETFDL